MSKKIVLISFLVGFVVLGWIFLSRPKDSLISPTATQKEGTTKVQLSETLKEYTDSSGFSFSYPDNLSIVNNEIEDPNTYADIKLFANGINGSLSLKISDSKFTTLDDWLKLNKNAAIEPAKEVKLGNLKALEVKLNDRWLLGALDLGVLFTIEMPRIEEDFWMKVYNKILEEFAFVQPQQDTNQQDSSSDEIIFEGEEVLE